MSKRTIASFFTKPTASGAASKAKKPKTAEVTTPPAEPAALGDAQIVTELTSGEPTTSDVESIPNNGERLQGEQLQRAELNKSIALAKVAMRQAAEIVAAARAQGEAPQLEPLLIESGWKTALGPEFTRSYFTGLEKFVRSEWQQKTPIYPPADMVFRAFNTCAFNRIRVVILGQDPYHGPEQAMGLCFSVPRGAKVPSSLLNMYKELGTDLGCTRPTHGDLHKWTTQGVLLLNTALTVRANQANSHAKKGWEQFTDAAIRAMSKERSGIVFMLWGNSAKAKEALIDTRRHTVLKAAHPSGLSASRGFFGCRHFSLANEAIQNAGGVPIDWQIDP